MNRGEEKKNDFQYWDLDICHWDGIVSNRFGSNNNWVSFDMNRGEGKSMGCEYCVTDRDGYIKPLEKNCHAYVSHSSLYGYVIELKAKGWNGYAKIQFCPMCGRELKHES